MANLIALFYNWWNLYLRFYDGEHHREAIRSRPLLMSGGGRQVQSGGQRTIREKSGSPACLREPAYCSVAEIPVPRPLSQSPTLILPRECGITVPISILGLLLRVEACGE